MTIWNPFYDMDGLRREIDRAFESAGMSSLARRGRVAFLPGRAARQYPLVNVYDNGETLTVEALAPGVDPDKVDLTVLHNTLTIAGEKVAPETVTSERWHRMERSAGRFMRRVELPAEADPDKVSAIYRNGLRVVTPPRAESARPRKVTIQAD